MPTYDYVCSECKQPTEAFQKITDQPLKTCPHCHKDALRRKPGGGIGIALKGDGFYATMYGDKKESKESANGCCPCGKNKTDCKS